MSKPVSQEVRAPFCILPARSVPEPDASSPLVMALAPLGAAILVFGIWDLVQAPGYSVSVVIMLFGAVLLWTGGARIHRALRRPREPVGYWIGFDAEDLLLARHDHVCSWPWTDVGTFRVTESVRNEFVTRYKGSSLDSDINFEQTISIALMSEAADGPPIEIPFEHFINVGQNPRAGADTLCLFLNDVRHRALNGGLAAGAAPFLAPIDLRIVPMRQPSETAMRSRRTIVPQSAIQRQ